jgi:hypothetical protein
MRRLLFAFIFLWSLTTGAQHIEIQSGFSFASGNFGNTDLAKPEDGFATSGWTIGLQAGYLVHKKIGICTRIHYSAFGVNTDKYQEQLNATMSSGTSVTVKSNGDYKNTSAMAGPYISLGKKNLTFDLRLLAGFSSLTRSGFTYTTSYSGQEYTSAEQAETDAGIAFGWGLTARYALPKNLSVSLNLDNTYAGTEFNRNGYNSSKQDKITRPYESFLLTFGIGYAIQ